MSSKLIVLATFTNEINAEIVRAKLEANGINSFVFKDDCGGMEPQLQLILGVQVLVDSEDIEKAKKLLRKVKSYSTKVETWKCCKCEELIEGQFTECWKCGWSH
ncbi:MAG TPA: DUF2007 domain-containing protein [Spirochaetes bacterium]|nr:DUF2007 domain-containing protein [Spirochaetota bacterium]